VTTDQRIANRYALERRLGVGGMSTVQLAFDERLERQVAIKLLAEHLADDQSFVSRFRREALAAARLVHPNIVQVFDFGLDERSQRHFIVMEYVQGRSCAEILRDDGPMTVDQVVDVATQACRGLDHAHRHGVVHRDVKPGNLMVSTEGIVKLADFGIAKAAEQSSITQVGSVLGTAAYLAPEQARGEEAGPPADLYALGVCVYQLLSGRLPYEATSLTELAIKQQQEPAPRLDLLVPEVPTALATAVEVALALDPAQRYPSAPAMAQALQDGMQGIEPETFGAAEATEATQFLGEGTDATRAMTGPPTARGTAAEPVVRQPRQPRRPVAAGTDPYGVPQPDPRGQQPKKRSGRRWLAVLLVLALVAAGVAAIVIFAGNQSSKPTLGPVDANQVPELVDQLEQLVNDNTR